MNYKIFLSVFSSLTITCVSTNVIADPINEININKSSFHIEALYLQPNTNNLKYAVFVSGSQPYHQSWHNQIIKPEHAGAFALGLNYAIPCSPYNFSADWLHAGNNDSSFKQALDSTDPATVQFVAPPYDVGPGVFGIKRADSTVKSNFNNVDIDVGKVFAYGSEFTGRIFTGISILNISQNLSTTFSDYAGSPEIPGQAYVLPADPNYNFTTKNTSDYLGIGPNIGVNLQYLNCYGFGVIGQFAGSLTVGTISAKDEFTSRSNRLLLLGISPTHQEITTPNTTQLVPGFQSKLGVLYNHNWRCLGMTIEGGYHFAYYVNAISTISPDTLVQAGIDPAIPEFATGTMAINSTTSTNGPFSLSGPYLNFTVAIV